MGRVEDTVLFEDARLIFKNFKGEEGSFNRKGSRNFHVLLQPDIAQAMVGDGWNVKFLKKREDDDPNEPEQAHLPVQVSYDIKPPHIVMLSSAGRTELSEKEVEILDYVDIEKVDFIVNPYNFPSINGRPPGVSAYLKSMFVTIREDYLEQKYANVGASGQEEFDGERS